MRILYTCLLYLLAPFVPLRLLWRSRKAPAYRRRIAERFGFSAPLPADRPVCWLHTVSVGEFLAAQPLLTRLMAAHPDYRFLVTTTTPTGAARVEAGFGDRVIHRYLPYDLPGAVARFLKRTRPRIGIVMETELWPNLYRQCHDRAIPLILVNARMSERSARGYGRVAGLARATLHCLSAIAAQGEEDRARLLDLGAQPDRVQTTGSIKFDLELPPGLDERGAELRQRWGAGRPAWIAASTHRGEDEQVLDAFAEVRRQIPEALLVLVPRHPERFDEVARLCQGRGFFTARRSLNDCDTHANIYLGDTMGELMLMYAAADVAFVGGSLVPTGGHNLLEPAALGLPVLTGPHMFNFAEINRSLLGANAAFEVSDSGALAAQVINLLRDQKARIDMGGRGREMVERSRGALGRVLEMVERYL